jgi:hypothetical protein
MGQNMKGCGWMISNMARDWKLGWMAVAIKAIISRAKNKEKGRYFILFVILHFWILLHSL